MVSYAGGWGHLPPCAPLDYTLVSTVNNTVDNTVDSTVNSTLYYW